MADEYDIVKAIQKIEDELIASIIRNMRRHKAEEIKEDKQWTMWQVEQLKSLEKFKKQNQKKYGKAFEDINKQIKALIRIAKDDGEMEQEIEILNAIKNGFKGMRKVTPGASAEFFKLNDRKLEALIDATVNDMQKAETAILRRANDQYRKIIYDAQVYANSGAGTYEKAVDMATKDFLSAGIQCVEYANGARHTLSDYADMAIRTASKRAYLQGEGQKRQEWGITTVIMNKRGNPCPKCLPFCGKVLIDDVWSGGRSDGVYPETGKKYPTMSYAISKGLYHPRCKDSHTTYFPGISTADDKWTKEELENIGIQAKQEARQQYAERQAERFGRLAKYSLDEENRREYKKHEQGWRRKFMVQQTEQSFELVEEIQDGFTPAKTLKQAEEFGKGYSSSGEFSVNGEFKIEVVNGFNEAADNVQKRFGRKLKINGIERVKAGDARYHQASYDSQAGMIKLKNSSIKTYQDLAEKNFASGWSASKDKYGTFYHEIGHAVWEDLPADAKSEIRNLYQETRHLAYEKWMSMGGSYSNYKQADVFGKELSRYGIENEQEFFSECFSQIMSGRMRPVSRRTNSILDKHYRVKVVVKSKDSGIIEMYRKADSRAEFKFISDETFNNLTIPARKKGAVIIRGTKEAEEHLEKLGAAASNVGDVLVFRKDVCVSEVLEETYHFQQNIEKMNGDKEEPLRSILNEIDAKQYLLKNSDQYKIPRNEVELTKRQLEAYKKQLEAYRKGGR